MPEVTARTTLWYLVHARPESVTGLFSERGKTWHQHSGAMRKGKDESLSCLWCFQSAFRQTAKHLNVSTMLNLMLDQMV